MAVGVRLSAVLRRSDTTIERNVRFGRPEVTDTDVRSAFEDLGLGWRLDHLADGLATSVGERGSNLSVGERSSSRWLGPNSPTPDC